MSSSYAERKLQQAIVESGGSASGARRLIVGWAARDPRLLQELAEPFLTGIVGHAVDRAIRTMPKPRKARPVGALGETALEGVVRALSQNFEGGASPFVPHDAGKGPTPSAAHAEVIRGLAKAQVRRRALAFDQASSARR